MLEEGCLCILGNPLGLLDRQPSQRDLVLKSLLQELSEELKFVLE